MDAAAPLAAKAARAEIAERTPATVKIMQWVFGLGMAVGIMGFVAKRLRPRAEPAAPQRRAPARSKQAQTVSAPE